MISLTDKEANAKQIYGCINYLLLHKDSCLQLINVKHPKSHKTTFIYFNETYNSCCLVIIQQLIRKLHYYPHTFMCGLETSCRITKHTTVR